MLNYNLLEAEKLEFVEVAAVSEIQNGERLLLSIDEFHIVVFNIAGKFFAIADLCSHDGGPLGEGKLEDEFQVACPRHGARFDLRTGAVRSLPAIEDIPAYPVRVVGDTIEVGLPLEA